MLTHAHTGSSHIRKEYWIILHNRSTKFWLYVQKCLKELYKDFLHSTYTKLKKIQKTHTLKYTQNAWGVKLFIILYSPIHKYENQDKEQMNIS